MSISTLSFIKKRAISIQKKEEAYLQIQFNDVYDISCSDINQQKRYTICSTIDQSKQIVIGKAISQLVTNETKFYTLKYKVIAEEINSTPIKVKNYEFEINVKQLFEYCQNEQKAEYHKDDQIAFYEQKGNPQGFAELSILFSVLGKHDKNNRQK
ncbi:hypothetical protein TTHERM_00683270 (macronuclear) [Tetrahymena thermophila SB210]|uniref:Uncharacterized protein n=1 Tax=Tetrahymena thermophila (strain SB210) TaxID=312017 RepID=I7MB16_TETTS|nr:hypothetical protein TTHERM_00683270 [Tetrahymena thermophila SB210]EAS07121.1 hypothetical protein TTHERM_00683270 [Tetrahymena thermophila SB210]|eukprot:XP_001027363.1 hypothetical protein TTHERM_00683270 [Tetrahymena thermophila SB210]